MSECGIETELFFPPFPSICSSLTPGGLSMPLVPLPPAPGGFFFGTPFHDESIQSHNARSCSISGPNPDSPVAALWIRFYSPGNFCPLIELAHLTASSPLSPPDPDLSTAPPHEPPRSPPSHSAAASAAPSCHRCHPAVRASSSGRHISGTAAVRRV